MDTKNNIWNVGDYGVCEYIKNEFAVCRILKINKNNTANIVLFIKGRKIKRTTTEDMDNVSLSKISKPEFSKKLMEEKSDVEQNSKANQSI